MTLPDFWSRTVQDGQCELLAVAAMVILRLPTPTRLARIQAVAPPTRRRPASAPAPAVRSWGRRGRAAA
ncbi:hypothetical protein [Streptomyces sp. NPDC090036]|uniref:hypothetical protein n=1 Tax=Streptomyces sp. NPDC090036 TaxID=3365926 RepID=UPI0038096EBC